MGKYDIPVDFPVSLEDLESYEGTYRGRLGKGWLISFSYFYAANYFADDMIRENYKVKMVYPGEILGSKEVNFYGVVLSNG